VRRHACDLGGGSTDLGQWRDAEIEQVMRKGVDRHGRQLMPPKKMT